MAATSDVIMLLWLPWKPIRCHVTILNWKYTGRTLITHTTFYVNYLNTFENRGKICRLGQKKTPIRKPEVQWLISQLSISITKFIERKDRVCTICDRKMMSN